MTTPPPQEAQAPAARPGEREQPPSTAAPESRARRWFLALVSYASLVREAPLTLAFLGVLWIVAIASGSLPHGPSQQLADHVGAGTASLTGDRAWTLLTYGFWCSGLTTYLTSSVLALALLLPAERRLGRLRTAWVFALCQVGGAALAIGAVELGALTGDIWLQDLISSDQTEQALGPSVGLVGVGLALSASLTALWRRRLRLLLVTGVLLFCFYAGEPEDVLRMGGAVVGLTTGVLLVNGRLGRPRLRPSSHAETRVLVALFASTSALGPAVTWLSNSRLGPLAIYSNLYIGSPATPSEIADTCTGADATANAGLCRELHASHLLSTSPSVLILLVPVLVLAVVAVGLWRGRRMAWWSALVVEAVLFAVTLRYAQQTLQQFRADPTTPGDVITALYVYSALLLLVPVAVVAVLLATRRHFALRAPRGTALTFLGLTVFAFVLVGAVYITFGYDVRDQFDPTPTFNQLVADYPKRLIPGSYLALFAKESYDFVPVGGTAKVLYVLVGPAFWLVTLGGLLLTFWRAATHAKDGDAARAEALLLRYGGSTLSYMTTWPGNSYWISADGQAAVAYRVIGTIALTMGDPYGAEDARARAVGEFTGFCDRQGWSPCFYSVTSGAKAAGDALGWSSVQVAEDTLLPLAELAFTGKKWQDVRSALNKAGKAGITAQWFTFPTAPLSVQEQIRALSEEWVADKGLPEMGFTLGGLDELDDPRVRCLIALDADGTLHGITSWLPSYRAGEPVGWTLDFMRRGAEGFRGVMEFLIASAALGFKEEGAEFLSLSGAPLARIDRGTQPVPLQRLLDVAGQALEPVYGFRSLLAFKAKFQPQYLPLYMSYPDPAALPAIGSAIGRAYLPHTTPGQMFQLSRKLMG
jgi:phosphatidylglycerol lysyltransferase